jgi:antitoxin component of MazEF toxin-antitoxin module
MTIMVKKLGGSVAVIIPKALAREMELVEGTPLDVSVSAAGIVLRKQGRRPRRSLRGIVARIDAASYRRHSRELSGDRPVGREIW